MISDRQLFSVGGHDFRTRHLLVIGVLAISFSLSTMVRSQALDYGFELNEFDPFFNYRATNYMVENGLPAYMEWHDDMSWHPTGRDVSRTSQFMLHAVAAGTYYVFGGDMSVYEFTIILPVIFGSITAIIIFAMVRVIAGTSAGLLASLLFAISVPVIVRGTIGWFKSEPLGLLFGLLGIYLLLSGIRSSNHKFTVIRLVGGGIAMTCGLSAWGGIQFFVIPLGLFFMALPFLRKDHGFLLWAIPLFTGSTLASLLLFERPGLGFITALGGVAFVGTTVFMIACIMLMRFSREAVRLRNGLALLGGSAILGIAILLINEVARVIGMPQFRYLNAINPFLTTKIPLADSIAEHATTTLSQSFYFLSVLMIFAGIGVWYIFRMRQESMRTMPRLDMTIFVLILSFTGVYISSAFIRLELFASIAVITLSSIAITMLASHIFSGKRAGKKSAPPAGPAVKIAFVVVVIAFLISPTIFPEDQTWINAVKSPPTILNGGLQYLIVTDDWPDALNWIKENTPVDAIIAAWWDYGYWITTMGERTTLADNFTVNNDVIAKIARTFISTPDDAWHLLQEQEADYFLIYLGAQKIQQDPTGLYILSGGGDESKKQWFMRIAEDPVDRYLHGDGFSGKDHFWQNTILGHMIPFTPVVYVDFATNIQDTEYVPGYTPVYTLDIKYPEDGDGPLRLVYMSPSMHRNETGVISGVIIYEVNKDYQPMTPAPAPKPPTQKAIAAVLETTQGDITITFRPDVAPNTVDNFVRLAESGFYDDVLFHRIVPGFVIQAGDPNTVSGPRDTWGQGDPGYKIDAEFSDLSHTKYAVSMARGGDINSAGSQFFIVLEDAQRLDGRYTIFGAVTAGQDVVDAIAAIQTNDSDQPVDAEQARITGVRLI